MDKSHSRRSGGTGLGLSIVEAVIRAHGGEVSVENKENGVEFGFKIPLGKQSIV